MEKVTPIGTEKGVAKRGSRTSIRNRSRNWEKAVRAYDLRQQGKSLYEIAETLEIKSAQEVAQVLSERFSYDAGFLSTSERESILALELARCDKLQSAAWEEAMTGEPRAIDSVLKVMAHRAKLVGLEKVDPVVQKNLVLVMGEKEADYIQALKATTSD